MSFLALGAVGLGLSAYGQMRSARTRQRFLQHQQTLLNIQANEVMKRAQMNEWLINRGEKRLSGEQKVAMAGSGIDIGTGSALDTLEQTARIAAEEVMKNNRDARFEAESLRHRGELAGAMGKEARTAGTIGAFGSILTGGAMLGFASGYSPGA